MECLKRSTDREITKRKYCMETADELIGNNNYLQMEIAVKQGPTIVDKITDLTSQLEGRKLAFGASA